MTSKNRILFYLQLAVATCMIAACGSTSTVTADADSDKQFGNFVVIGIAGDYDTRAHLERQVVSQLRREGAQASTYYSVVGGNKPVTREAVGAVVAEHGFDAVLAIRRIDGDVELKVTKSRTAIDATPIGGRFLNLFRSDYTDYTNPGSIDLAARATLAVELYDVTSQDIVFSFDHETRQDTDIGLLIDQTAVAVVRRLDREKLIRSSGN
ncbi:MAG: hypothetical protein P8X81_09270 [Woeseiaceae bacterium]